MKAILDLIARHKAGEPFGMFSVCSAHPLVIEATFLHAKRSAAPFALIEATSNQVNQEGGYTGMKPVDFRDFVHRSADRAGFPRDRILLGGDHLGPNAWQALPAAEAMSRAEVLIADYVDAGFRKIHLDCSMPCADDPMPLPDETIAKRAARLCAVAERAHLRAEGEPPVYVIGTEVPVPGGAAEELGALAVTTPEAARATIDMHRAIFADAGLANAWPRVIAVVVQPGVEFDHRKVVSYVPAKARALSRMIEGCDGLIFEAHSTDYQTPAALAALVRDHFAILKVGPGVTFALREALWALVDIERDMGAAPAQSLKQVVLGAMQRDPQYWKAYYTHPATETFDLQYSLSDRIRYYWSVPEVQESCDALLTALRSRGIPLTLLSQYFPVQYAAVRAGALANDPRELVLDAVGQVLAGYAEASRPAADARAAAGMGSPSRMGSP